MILLLDIGNTRIKYATLKEQRLIFGGAASHADVHELHEMLHGIMETPAAVYLANVAGEVVEESVHCWCLERWGLAPVVLKSERLCAGVINGYAVPSALGVDRWAAMIGAYQQRKRAVVVVDCGSACTADVIDAEGRHLGGAIVPGLHMLRESLNRGTSVIAKAEPPVEFPSDFGRNTDECIEYGVTESLVAFIEKVSQHASSLLQDEVLVFITGGDAPYLLPRLAVEAIYEKNLVLMGMAGIVAEKEARE